MRYLTVDQVLLLDRLASTLKNSAFTRDLPER